MPITRSHSVTEWDPRNDALEGQSSNGPDAEASTSRTDYPLPTLVTQQPSIPPSSGTSDYFCRLYDRQLPQASTSVDPCLPDNCKNNGQFLSPKYDRGISTFDSSNDREILQQELLLEEEELQLKKKRLALLKLSRKSSGCDETKTTVDMPDTCLPGTRTSQATESMMLRPTCGLTLPKLEIEPFSGSADEYVNFLCTFSTQIEPQLTDNYTKLCYLIYYCRGVAKEAIKHCVLLPKDTCFDSAMKILKAEFGRPYQVIQSVTGTVFNGPVIKSNDIVALQTLLRQMRCCQITLTQLGRIEDLNCSTNLLKIVRRLPKPIQIRWAEVAEVFLSIGKSPTFDDLLSLVEKRVSIGTTEYGMLVTESNSSSVTSRLVHRTATIKRVPDSETCPVCAKAHALERCEVFQEFDVSRRWAALKDHKRCFRCLRGNHRIRDCRARNTCQQGGCTKSHHPLLHFSESTVTESDNDGYVCSSYSLRSSSVQLGFVPVNITGPCGSIATYAFLDNGSDCTLITRDFANLLGLPTEPTTLRISTLHGVNSVKCCRTKASLSAVSGDFQVDVDSLIVVDQLPVREVDQIPPNISRWPHLDGIKFSSLPSNKVGLLLGCDVPVVHQVMEQKIGKSNDPFASRSVLGWILRGPTGHQSNRTRCVNAISTCSPSIDDLLVKLYETDFHDTKDTEERHLSIEDRRAYDIVSASANRRDGHYEVTVPWKGNECSLPNNWKMAESRLDSLRRKLMRDENLRARYAATMRKHLESNHIRLGGNSKKRWFLPHHPVIHRKKPEKLRIVFDCAATYQGFSLNDVILQGPDFTNSLTGVLLRFCRYRIAISADIKEMFLQVLLPEADKWAFSLLWWENDVTCEKPLTYEWNVHPFGATSSPFCANYALRQTLHENIKDSRLPSADVITRQFYVDDLLYSTNSLDEASILVNDLPKVLNQGGFDLVKWSSNCEQTLRQVDSDKCINPLHELPSAETCQRTLGVKWHRTKDVFIFDMIEPPSSVTRRNLLSYVASIYDPLGFIAPVVLPGKLLLQDTCRQKLGWDANLDTSALSCYKKWIELLKSIPSLEIKRCLLPSLEPQGRCDLHVFSDASELAYSTVAYLCYTSHDGTRCCRFLMGKARVAPLKFVTIPRLELTAALIATQLCAHIVKELDIRFTRVVFWTDSAIVLRYLSTTSARFVTFVANRVQKILSVSNIDQWRHVPTELNPADVGSRGLTTASFSKVNFWLNGPAFLRDGDKSWPNVLNHADVDSSALELKRVVAVTTSLSSFMWLQDLVARSQKWLCLLRKVVWLGRFKKYLMIKKLARTDVLLDVGRIKVCELESARIDIVRATQSEFFDREVQKTESLRKLKPVVVNGILCLNGRVRTSSDGRSIPILPNNAPVVEVLINYHHEICGHSGASHVLASIRRNYWIIKGMATVKRVLRNCRECRILHAPQCQQAMAPLPSFRTEVAFHPFSHTGVDCFGPLYVKINRSQVKRFGCLFTCMQTRAIHIEVLHNMSSDSFLMALQRFVCRRGTPTSMYSDNGSNFVGAEAELRTLHDSFNSNQVQNAVLAHRIEWNFNPPLASHRGGVWERMIRTVRKVLSHVVKEQVLTEEVLLTSLAEVERIVNDRPLIPVYDDPDQPTTLRPNDLLLLRSNQGLTYDDDIPLKERLTKRWRQAQHLANMFWRRWKLEYLPTLQATHKWLNKSRNLKAGDVVLLAKTDSPRGEWPKGLVIETYPGLDGLVRKVLVRTPNGNVRRDVRSLCLLEGALE